MSSAADLDIFVVLDVTLLVFAQSINMRETGPWETDWIVQRRQWAGKPVCLLSVML